MRNTRASSSDQAPVLSHSTTGSTTFLESLKEELFQLETDRLRGAISADEYASARQALEKTFKRLASRKLDQEKVPATALPGPSATSRITG